MGNVNLPAAVVVTGAVLCLLAGFLLGVVAGPESPVRTTGTVDTYNPDTGRLCLTGDAVAETAEANENGEVCGHWQRTAGSRAPEEGDSFRFVTLEPADAPHASGAANRLMIYGDVVD